jgi:signal-transduction protein with cAMP-binding, CBS, and nucleotidyltransferase domain
MKTGYKVSDAMTQDPLYVFQDEDTASAAKVMKQYNVGALLVKEKAKLSGIATEEDFVRKVVAEGKDPKKVQMKDIMTHVLHTIAPEKDIFEALMVMRDFNIRHLPVVKDGKLLGLLTMKDILKIEPQLFDMLADAIELREEERKPINTKKSAKDEGICQLCGNYSEKTRKSKDGILVCNKCL